MNHSETASAAMTKTLQRPPAPAPEEPRTKVAGLAPRVRDLRLDFFRGLAMFIILVAHTPGNFLASWIPARWGFSDATEIFVFCSGMASAIAFGGGFDRVGWRLGSARVLFRVWQVYWAHVGLFCATIALTVWLTDLEITGMNYWGQLNLWPVFVESEKWANPNIFLSFMTLRYVPNYFDVLPMYMVVLLFMPIIMLLVRVNFFAVAAFVFCVWLMAQETLMHSVGLEAWHLALPAEPWSSRIWFFNPFGWQLIFFTGFAFMRGWLPKPPVSMMLVLLAAVVVLATIPLSDVGVREFDLPWAEAWRAENAAWFDKTSFAPLRYLHFLALAYLAWVVAGDKGNRLLSRGNGMLARVWGWVVTIVLKVGQQSLAVFVVSMFLARLMGFGIDVTKFDTLSTVLINIAGCMGLVATAYGAGWFKSQPWKKAIA